MSPLEEIRHSTAHVLAAAVLRLYPNTKLDIGPPTDKGFYYDFDSEIAFTPEILEDIEAEMRKIIKENQRFERIEVSREEAKGMILEMKQETYKLGRLNDIPDEDEVSFYRNGEFLDLVRRFSCQLHQENQGFQTFADCRLLSPWRLQQQTIAEDLRYCVCDQG